MNKHSFFTSNVTSFAVAQTKRVPVIVMNTSRVFFRAIIEGAQDAASQAHGVTVIPMGSTQEDDLMCAIRTFEDAVSQKPVTVTPAYPDAFELSALAKQSMVLPDYTNNPKVPTLEEVVVAR
jgi:ABC-type sugar transport system substrate-binding protein